MSYTLPTIHLNGSGRDNLLRDYNNAYKQLIAFRDTFAAIEFNARDYYVQSPEAFPRARASRDEQLRKIGELMQYLEAHLVELGR